MMVYSFDWFLLGLLSIRYYPKACTTRKILSSETNDIQRSYHRIDLRNRYFDCSAICASHVSNVKSKRLQDRYEGEFTINASFTSTRFDYTANLTVSEVGAVAGVSLRNRTCIRYHPCISLILSEAFTLLTHSIATDFIPQRNPSIYSSLSYTYFIVSTRSCLIIDILNSPSFSCSRTDPLSSSIQNGFHLCRPSFVVRPRVFLTMRSSPR